MTVITGTTMPEILARRAASRAVVTGHIRSLDSLRGVAALGVALLHAAALFGAQFAPHAYLAVDLFFALSGFILHTRYGAGIADGRTAFADFARARVARLYPLYLVVTLLAAALYATQVVVRGHVIGSLADVGRALVVNLAVLPDPLSSRVISTAALFPFVIAAWSVFWEFVLSGLFFVWARLRRRDAATHLASLVVGAASVLSFWASRHQGLNAGWTWDSFPIGALRALVGFGAGLLAARFVAALSRPGREAMARWVVRIGLAVAAIGLGYMALIQTSVWEADIVCALLVFPATVCALALWRSRLVENPLGDLLGGASYSIYLWHGLTITIASIIIKREGIAPSLPLGLTWLAATLALSWLSWTWIETPARRWVQRWRPSGPAAATPLARA